MFVADGFRRQGIGSAMLSQLVHEAESLNYLIVNARVAGDLDLYSQLTENSGLSCILVGLSNFADAEVEDIVADALKPGFPLSISGPTDKILLTAAPCNCELSLQCKVLSRATEGAIRTSREVPKGSNRPSFDQCF